MATKGREIVRGREIVVQNKPALIAVALAHFPIVIVALCGIDPLLHAFIGRVASNLFMTRLAAKQK